MSRFLWFTVYTDTQLDSVSFFEYHLE